MNPLTTDNAAHLDALVNACTACGSWDRMLECMRGGYCPTIYQDTRRKRMLSRLIVLAGFPVFIGGGFLRPAR